MKNTTLTIKGTHCNACKLLIEDVCRDIRGIKLCNVNFQTGRTIIEHDEHFDLNLFTREVEGLGQYKIEINP